MRDSATLAVINQTMARRFWKEESPLGKRLTLDATNWLTVVGIVGDVRYRLDESARPAVYVPFPNNQHWPGWLTLAVRTRLLPTSLGPMLRKEVQLTDPNLPVAGVQTIEEAVLHQTLQRRLLMAILQAFVTITLVIASVGIYGVIAENVTQRTREIGIRMAVGATPWNVLWYFLRRCARLLVFGLMIGIGGAIAAVRLLEGFLYGITPMDLPTLIFASAVLSIVAMGASFIPARRAAKADPMAALRCQ
jgi:predicted lysophospholipase L1 biosynthesis ABC-type transport system permease subunit